MPQESCNWIGGNDGSWCTTCRIERARNEPQPACPRATPQPGDAERPNDTDNRMVQIKTLIADMQSILERYGNTCVYIRRGGLSWGAVALNRRDDDEKHGVFDIQAQHDRNTQQRVEQVERLIASRNAAQSALAASQATIAGMTMSTNTEITRLHRELAAARAQGVRDAADFVKEDALSWPDDEHIQRRLAQLEYEVRALAAPGAGRAMYDPTVVDLRWFRRPITSMGLAHCLWVTEMWTLHSYEVVGFDR